MAGTVVLTVDGSSYIPSSAGPDQPVFGTLHKRITIEKGKMNDLRPHMAFIMTPINEKTATFIPADQEVIVNFNNQIPGLKLHVPAGAAVFPDGSKEGTITVTEIHPQFAPATLPDGRMPLMYMALEPDGLSFSQPVPFQFGLDPAYGFTAGAEFGFAT